MPDPVANLKLQNLPPNLQQHHMSHHGGIPPVDTRGQPMSPTHNIFQQQQDMALIDFDIDEILDFV